VQLQTLKGGSLQDGIQVDDVLSARS
jgi:hypothetical protein